MFRGSGAVACYGFVSAGMTPDEARSFQGPGVFSALDQRFLLYLAVFPRFGAGAAAGGKVGARWLIHDDREGNVHGLSGWCRPRSSSVADAIRRERDIWEENLGRMSTACAAIYLWWEVFRTGTARYDRPGRWSPDAELGIRASLNTSMIPLKCWPHDPYDILRFSRSSYAVDFYFKLRPAHRRKPGGCKCGAGQLQAENSKRAGQGSRRWRSQAAYAFSIQQLNALGHAGSASTRNEPRRWRTFAQLGGPLLRHGH